MASKRLRQPPLHVHGIGGRGRSRGFWRLRQGDSEIKSNRSPGFSPPHCFSVFTQRLLTRKSGYRRDFHECSKIKAFRDIAGRSASISVLLHLSVSLSVCLPVCMYVRVSPRLEEAIELAAFNSETFSSRHLIEPQVRRFVQYQLRVQCFRLHPPCLIQRASWMLVKLSTQ